MNIKPTTWSAQMCISELNMATMIMCPLCSSVLNTNLFGISTIKAATSTASRTLEELAVGV